MKFWAITLFCEDIREEKTGSETLVGVARDNFQAQHIPGLFPKLGLYTRLLIPTELEGPIEPVVVKLVSPEGSEHTLATFDVDFLAREIEGARKSGSPLLGLIAAAVGSPFPLKLAGRFLVIVATPTNEIISGQLNVLGPKENATGSSISQPPSEQSQTAAS
jgi:hypothetical protein